MLGRVGFFCAAALTVAIVGCGGSSTPSPAPTPSPGPTATIPAGPTSANVVLRGGGYTLSFTLPPLSAGSASTIAATLQTTVPAGVTVPQALRKVAPASTQRSSGSVKPQAVGVPLTTLVYLTAVPSATATFASVPSFTYTLPTGTQLATGSSAYVVFYDPAQSATGWVPVLGPGTQNGQTISFPGVASNVTLQGGSSYVYALVAPSQAVPSPSPSSSASPGSSPSPSPSPVAAAFCPAPAAGLFPMAIQNNSGVGGTITVFVYGLYPSNTSTWAYLTSATSGAIQTLPASGTPIPGFALPTNGCIDLPPLVSGRIFLALGGHTLAGFVSNGPTSGVAAPAPWSPAAPNNNVTVVYDFLEYTWTSTTSSFNIDVTQVDAFGIPVSFQAVNSSGTPAAGPLYGMKPHALSYLARDLTTLGSPWTGLIQATGTAGVSRVISPQHAANIPTDGVTPAPGASYPPGSPTFDPSYYNAIIAQIWSTYQGTNFLALSYPQFPTAYGLVNPATNVFTFYASPSTSSAVLGAIPYPTTWDVLNNAGAFAANATGTYGIYIGRALVVSIERGTLPVPNPLPATWPTTIQPFCGGSDWVNFYGGAATVGGTVPLSSVVTNWYSALMHKYGQQPIATLPGLAYAFPDDDECQNPGGNGLYDPDYSQTYTAGEQWNVTLNPF